tara:strand:- start:103 stop:1005 length:903 start_codon:yes stop_codon:yes gene_type:complete
MSDKLIKTGASTIILGEFHYKYLIPHKKNKLLKITKLSKHHNEFNHLDIIRSIPSYKEYYTIPDNDIKIIKPTDKFYIHLKNIIKENNIEKEVNIFNSELNYFFVDIAGDKELFDIFYDMTCYNKNFWNNYQDILKFVKIILTGLSFLHSKSICHLDIKPENIMVNTINKKYKIIDFGFSSKFPFEDFIEHHKGTPGYSPILFSNNTENEWFPDIITNDFTMVNDVYPLKINRDLIYKIDSFSFGRVLYILKYIYNNNKTLSCFPYFNKSEKKLNNIIESLTQGNVYFRLSINDCLEIMF